MDGGEGVATRVSNLQSPACFASAQPAVVMTPPAPAGGNEAGPHASHKIRPPVERDRLPIAKG
ncbi:MAG: hypothetical protein QOI58_1493 [Thermoanaerobaculia bacterium]|jgi:hypothetical protein|nr:hypothetical protein [Thermoanaerobaculia bacterium]